MNRLNVLNVVGGALLVSAIGGGWWVATNLATKGEVHAAEGSAKVAEDKADFVNIAVQHALRELIDTVKKTELPGPERAAKIKKIEAKIEAAEEVLLK